MKRRRNQGGRLSPDRILAHAARILASDPTAWEVLLERVGWKLKVPFLLEDLSESPPLDVVAGSVELDPSKPVILNVPGYGPNFGGMVAAIERYKGALRLFVWADESSEEHTNVIEIEPTAYGDD